MLFCERDLTSLVAANRLNDLSNGTQGAKKLLAGRAGLYCDIELTMRGALTQPDPKDDSAKIYIALDLGFLKLSPYLHKKNAELVPRLAALLTQMRSEGLLDAYRA